MSENNQLLKEILKEVREIKAHIIPSSISKNQVPNEDLTYIFMVRVFLHNLV